MRLLLLTAMLLLAGCTTPTEDHDHGDHDDHSHDDHGSDHMSGHDHDEPLDVGDNAPTVSLSALADAKSGWNVRIQTSNWQWAPLQVSTDHVDGQGHGHIYVDGTQVGRVFTEWLHLPALGEGDHTLKVTLNANSHQPLAANGNPIEAEITVTEVANDAMHHDHAAKDVAADGAPSVTITHVHEDPATVGKDSHKLALLIDTENFQFAPERASGSHVDGEGHAHVYLDGVKLGRLYGEAYHIGGVCSGEHTIRVTLNSNDHSDLQVNGELIEATRTFTLDGGSDCEAPDAMEGHNHG